MSAPILLGSRLKLRRPVEADIFARQALGVDPEIHRMYGGSRADLVPYTTARATDWYRGLVEQSHAWIIEIEGRMIGEVRLHSFHDLDRRAALAIGIADRTAFGCGYGTEATGLVLGYAFTTLGLHRISLRVLAYNERAIASYLKSGFVVEGRERESALVDGAWHDDVIMGILETDYRDRSP